MGITLCSFPIAAGTDDAFNGLRQHKICPKSVPLGYSQGVGRPTFLLQLSPALNSLFPCNFSACFCFICPFPRYRKDFHCVDCVLLSSWGCEFAPTSTACQSTTLLPSSLWLSASHYGSLRLSPGEIHPFSLTSPLQGAPRGRDGIQSPTRLTSVLSLL